MINIRSERNRLGMSQGQLANRLNVDETTLRRWEQGQTSIPSSKAIQMSSLFCCSVDYLFGLSEERTRAGVR